MFKTCLATLLGTGLASKTAPVFDENEQYFPQFSNLVSLAARGTLNERGTLPKELETTTDIPCNYFFNDAWYLLANTDV